MKTITRPRSGMSKLLTFWIFCLLIVFSVGAIAQPPSATIRQGRNGAATNPDSPVLIDQERCIGCNFCLAVCPFGSISPSYDGHKVVKCDLCFERLSAGQEPACVSGCPTGALKFVEAEQYAHSKRTETAEELASSVQQNKSKK